MFRFSLYDNELSFLERLLEEDIRNNSAWNHRFFVASHQVRSVLSKLSDRKVTPTFHSIGCVKLLTEIRCFASVLVEIIRSKKFNSRFIASHRYYQIVNRQRTIDVVQPLQFLVFLTKQELNSKCNVTPLLCYFGGQQYMLTL